jgi:hypothetical protein
MMRGLFSSSAYCFSKKGSHQCPYILQSWCPSMLLHPCHASLPEIDLITFLFLTVSSQFLTHRYHLWKPGIQQQHLFSFVCGIVFFFLVAAAGCKNDYCHSHQCKLFHTSKFWFTNYNYKKLFTLHHHDKNLLPFYK